MYLISLIIFLPNLNGVEFRAIGTRAGTDSNEVKQRIIQEGLEGGKTREAGGKALPSVRDSGDGNEMKEMATEEQEGALVAGCV